MRPTALLCAALLLAGCATAMPPNRTPLELAVTVDDLPVHGALPAGETRVDVATRMAGALRAAGVPDAYGFINAAALDDDPGLAVVLSAWRAAGFPLGNHTWSHPNLDAVGVERFAAEIAQNEPALQRYGRGNRRWFRYPFLAEGTDPARRAAVRLRLAERGYRIAAVTMDFSDWQWSDAYARCRNSENAPGLAKLEQAYLDAVREAIGRSRAMSRTLYGRDIPYVLLSHVSAFNARMMPRVLDVYRDAGFRFVSLPTAQRDPAYRADNDPRQPAAPATLDAKIAARGLPVPARVDRTAMLEAACR